jgi:hypothetical protein
MVLLAVQDFARAEIDLSRDMKERVKALTEVALGGVPEAVCWQDEKETKWMMKWIIKRGREQQEWSDNLEEGLGGL